MQVTKGTWHMREQCVPGSLSSLPAQEPWNVSNQRRWLMYIHNSWNGQHSLEQNVSARTLASYCQVLYGCWWSSCIISTYHLTNFVFYTIFLLQWITCPFWRHWRAHRKTEASTQRSHSKASG